MRTSIVAFLTCISFLALQGTCLAPPTEYALPNNPSPADHTGIQQTLDLFPISIDLKQYDLLSDVFPPQATANFNGRVITGVPAIRSYLQQGLADLSSQHNLGTLYINMTGTNQATSYNWLQGSFFGTGNLANQSFWDFGYYKDDLVKSKGRWLVQNRVFQAFGSYGNESVVSALLSG